MKNKIDALHIECTNQCNLQCHHCYASASPQSNIFLPFSKIQEVINELQTIGLQMVSISGGEPLLYPHLFDLIDYCKKLNLKVSLNTNGLLIDGDVAKWLYKLRLDSAVVSLHGSSPSIHAKLTGSHTSFYKALAAIQDLMSYNIETGVSISLNHFNIDTAHEIVPLINVYGIRLLYIFRFLSIGRGVICQDKYTISAKEHATACKRIFAEAQKLGLSPHISAESPYVDWNSPEYTIHSCTAGTSFCVISASGDVFGCNGLRSDELVCGNIFTESAINIWNNSLVLVNLRRFKESPYSLLKGKCSSCKVLESCHGGCRAFAYAMTKDLFGSDPSCWES